jgi:hypothetical protein
MNSQSAAERGQPGKFSIERQPVAESNGRILSRRPTRIMPGPPVWVQRRQES